MEEQFRSNDLIIRDVSGYGYEESLPHNFFHTCGTSTSYEIVRVHLSFCMCRVLFDYISSNGMRINLISGMSKFFKV